MYFPLEALIYKYKPYTDLPDCLYISKYRTRAIITRSRFETALDYKPRIFNVRKVSLYYKPLCNINRGLSHIFSFFNLNYTFPPFFILVLFTIEFERKKKKEGSNYGQIFPKIVHQKIIQNMSKFVVNFWKSLTIV